MKTAEEWMKQLGGHDSTGEHPPLISINKQVIREVQLDALKEGMKMAAEIARMTGLQYGDYDVFRDGRIVGNATKDAILATADCINNLD